MKAAILQGRNISKVYTQGTVKNEVLHQIDVDIYEKDFTVIMGSSGAGKSTLLYVLSGMDAASQGTVTYSGREISGLTQKRMAELRAEQFGFVFQQTHLVSNLTLFENVAVAGYVSRKDSGKQVEKRAIQLLDQMGVGKAGNRYPDQVSGGEAQRAAIARAMIKRPGIFFADEPTGALNKSNSVEVLNLLTELNRSGQSILMVTHDLRAAVRGNRILYMEDGGIVAQLTLDAYGEYEEKDREERINSWLAGLQW
ncbi:ABC transporter ATP-binding protein [Diplocloster hominis]|uniref:ABC transporter ATP-binding protein n=1 Tax=Diplocloster hominis TaxID=3079010 RepID=UPI0031BA1245